MEELVLRAGEIRKNGYWELRHQLHDFVKEHFELLYEGAVRLDKHIPADYYGCRHRRVQINRTRLHSITGLKYADGHKYNDKDAPSEGQLRQTVADLQTLCESAAKVVDAPFSITIDAQTPNPRAADFAEAEAVEGLEVG